MLKESVSTRSWCVIPIVMSHSNRADQPCHNQALRQEVTYASYLSLRTIVIPAPRAENRDFIADYARAVNSALASSWHINVS